MSLSYFETGIPRLAPGLAGMAVGLAGEVIVPWMTIWLSSWLDFDVPHWALWPIFGGPIVLGLSSALVVLIMQQVHFGVLRGSWLRSFEQTERKFDSHRLPFDNSTGG